MGHEHRTAHPATASTRRGGVSLVALLALTLTTVVVGFDAASTRPAGAAPATVGAPTDSTGTSCGAARSSTVLGVQEQEFVDRLNAYRASRGRGPLAVNGALSQQAREWSQYMADRNHLHHATTSWGAPSQYVYTTLMHQSVPGWTAAGENIGKGGSVVQLHDAFVGSPGHEENMVGNYNQVGVGVHLSGAYIWVTVRFAQGPPPAPPISEHAPAELVGERVGLCYGSQPLTGDFDGNGYDDVFLFGPGQVPDAIVYHGPGTQTVQPTTVRGTYQPYVADFDGDGRDDIAWYAPGPANDSIWFGTSDKRFDSVPFTISGRYQPLLGDWNGDGRTDLFLYAAGNDPDYYWYSTGRGFRSANRNIYSHYQPEIADFDGNGRDDMFWYAPGPNADSLWYNTSGGLISKAWPVHGRYQPQVGDFDGDGSSDILWYAPGPANDSVWYLKNLQIEGHPLRVSGVYDVTVGDFDGNGTDDLSFFDGGTGADPIWLFSHHRAAFHQIVGQMVGDYRRAVGDFDADGSDDLYWLHPTGAADMVWWGA